MKSNMVQKRYFVTDYGLLNEICINGKFLYRLILQNSTGKNPPQTNF